ncbi:MAG: DUF393 domain-containing protein [Desulfuromonas sp.]|uniref:thiol-disulfide oxidoreductase DCC family protein n=1 Tax=Desulfuromonas sp. TaxID=892 RepID=UPI000CC43528|nr:DUF393 domain-containing protein [Desulfuromonas sp.]PLX83759.1 MAG: DUF393 domain-containing protein [Desulfuromonas sp.]
MKDAIAYPLTVFYDGACIVCSREMEHYRRIDRNGRLLLVDISAPAFEPDRYGRSLEDFMAQMHVMDGEGRFFLGVDAFPAIWRALPGRGHRLLAGLIGVPGLHGLAVLGYRGFARFRRFLPRRRDACPEDTCGIRHRK